MSDKFSLSESAQALASLAPDDARLLVDTLEAAIRANITLIAPVLRETRAIVTLSDTVSDEALNVSDLLSQEISDRLPVLSRAQVIEVKGVDTGMWITVAVLSRGRISAKRVFFVSLAVEDYLKADFEKVVASDSKGVLYFVSKLSDSAVEDFRQKLVFVMGKTVEDGTRVIEQMYNPSNLHTNIRLAWFVSLMNSEYGLQEIIVKEVAVTKEDDTYTATVFVGVADSPFLRAIKLSA